MTNGLRHAHVRVEPRLDGMLAIRHGERYLSVKACAMADKARARPVKPAKKRRLRRRGSDWNKNFDMQKGPKVWQAAQSSDSRRAAMD